MPASLPPSLKQPPLALTFILGALATFAPFAIDMYLAGFAQIATSLNTDIHHVQLSVSAFFFGLAIGQLLYGPLIDRVGRRVPLLIGITVFSISSLLLIVAPNISVFIGLRFIQALGGCAGIIIGRAIIHDLFEQREAARTLSLMMMVQGVGPIVAPVLGSYLVVIANWQAIFIFLTGFALLCLLMVLAKVPETLTPEHRQKRTLREIFSIFAHLLTQPSFIFPTLVGSFMLSNMFTFIAGSPYVFMELYGVAQTHYGWLFAANAAGMLINGQLNRALLKKFLPYQIMAIALAVNLFSALILVALTDSGSLWLLILPLFFCLSLGPLIMANAVAIAMSKHRTYLGMASSLVGILQYAFAGMVTVCISLFHNGTAYPMTLFILLGSVLAAGMFALGWRAIKS